MFKDAEFSRRARKTRVSDDVLRNAIRDADAGIVAAYLGGELIKLRVARRGGGKSAGFRTIVAYRRDDRAFFIHLFAKNAQANVSDGDLRDLKEYAGILLALTDEQIEAALSRGKLEEIE